MNSRPFNRFAGILGLLWICLPGLCIAVPTSFRVWFIHEIEKREPVMPPRLGSARDFLDRRTYRQLADFLRDALPYRGLGVLAKNLAARYGLGENRFGDVVIGRQGWMFLRSMYYRPYEDEAMTRRMLRLVRTAVENPPPGCDLRVLIAPDKDVIIPELLNPNSRAEAEANRRRRDLIHNFCEDRADGRVFGVWDLYRAAKTWAPEPLFYHQDTHHTSWAAAALLSRSIVEAFQPGLWDPRDLKFLESHPKVADLALIAGLGPLNDVQRTYDQLRPGVEFLEKTLAHPERGWQSPAHYRARSATQRLIPGRTLILHDSYLAECRETLGRYFADVTYMHYNDVIAAGDPRGRFADYDRVLIEVVERQSAFVLDQLMSRYDSQPAAEVPPGALINLNPDESDSAPGADGFCINVKGTDPAFRLPPWPVPAGREYALNVELATDVATRAQLFTLSRPGQYFDDPQSSWAEVAAGQNSLWFALPPGSEAYPMRFDPGFFPARFLIRRVRLFELQYDQDDYTAALSKWDRAGAMLAPRVFQSLPGPCREVDLQAPQSADGYSQVSQDDQGLMLIAGNSDPQLLLPAVPCEPGARPVLRLRISAPGPTQLQLFFRDAPDQAFQEARSLRRDLGTGVTEFAIPLRVAWLASGLRLDPGWLPGAYRIQSLAVTGVKLPAGRLGVQGTAAPDLRNGTLWFVYPGNPFQDLTADLAAAAVTSDGQLVPEGGEVRLRLPAGPETAWTWPALKVPDLPFLLVKLHFTASAPGACRVKPAGAAAGDLPVARAFAAGENALAFLVTPQALASGLRWEVTPRPAAWILHSVNLLAGNVTPTHGEHDRRGFQKLSRSGQSALFSSGTFDHRPGLEIQAGKIQAGNPETRVRFDRAALRITAGSSDPFLILPRVIPEPGGEYILRLELTSGQAGECQLFLAVPGRPGVYDELHSQRAVVPSGSQTVYFYLNAEDLSGPLRFDPGPRPGEYRLDRIRIRRLAAPRPEES